jgi:hypothetical protein
MSSNKLTDSEKYFINTIDYNQGMYDLLTEKAKALDEQDEAEKYVKFMLVSAAQESLFKIKEVNSMAKVVFKKDFDVREDLIPLINEIKPSFYLKDSKLINVSGMELEEMIDYIKDAVASKNEKNAGTNNS